MVYCVQAANGLADMTGDEDNYEEAKTMHANFAKMRDAFDIKARLGIEAVGAYDQKEWFESFRSEQVD